MVIFESWSEMGIANANYNPVQLYPEGFTQTFYQNADHPLADERGNLYYLSHPPLAFYIPYFLLNGFGISVIGLQVINLFFHGLSAIFIYLIALRLFGKQDDKVFGAGFVAAGVYLLSPATLWFQGNIFFADLFSVNCFIACLYFTLNLCLSGKANSKKSMLAFAVSLFLFCYADWLGFLFAFIVFLFAFAKAFVEKFYISIALTSVVVVAVAGLLIGWQYSQVNGLEAFLETSLFRWQERGMSMGNDQSVTSTVIKTLKKFQRIGIHYLTSYLPVLTLIAGLIVARIIIFKNREKAGASNIRLLFLLGLVPIILHHFIFLKYSAFHDFSVLKSAPFIALFTAFISVPVFRLSNKLISWAVFGLTAIMCINQYYYINRPGQISWKGHRYDAMKTIGLAIKEQSNQDEVIFLNGIKGPQIIYYAKRNIFYAPDTTVAKQVLKTLDAKKGRLFSVKNRQIETINQIFNE